MTRPALELDGITRTFAGRTVLDRLSLSVSAGEYVTMLGPSASGKSTILRVIAGFDSLDDGDIRVDGRSMRGLPAHERGIGFVFQSFALFPHLSVADNVAFGLRHRQHDPVTDAAEIDRRVADALELTGLQGLGGRLPSQISGGQKQRVAFARTLIAEPPIVLLDEPLGALDARLRERMMIELRRIHDRLGATFLHVTGNEQEALAMGTRVAVLSDGRIAQVDAPDTLIDAPASRDVARLLNCYNVLTGGVGRGVRRPRAGPSVAAKLRSGQGVILRPLRQHRRRRRRCVATGRPGSRPRTIPGQRILRRPDHRPVRRRRRPAVRGRILPRPPHPAGVRARPRLCTRVAGRVGPAIRGGLMDARSDLADPIGLAPPPRLRQRNWTTAWLLAPGMIWMALFLVVPILMMVYVSFWTQTTFSISPKLTLRSWTVFFSSATYLDALWTTIRIWLVTLAATLVIGYPVALYIGLFVRDKTVQTILLVVCVVPFWTSFLIRVVAWRPMLGTEGAVNIVLMKLGLITQPISVLLFTELSVVIGMTQIYVVFMVGPIAFMLSRIDPSLIEAARDLGAGWGRILRTVVLPLSMPGVVVGAIFVSVMVLGEFATPAALSGRKVNMLGNIIVTQVGSLKWAFAAVVGVVLTVLMAAIVAALLRFVDLRNEL